MGVQLDVGQFVSRSAFCRHSKLIKQQISRDEAHRVISFSTSIPVSDAISRLSKRRLVLVTITTSDYMEGIIVEKKHGKLQFFSVLHEYEL